MELTESESLEGFHFFISFQLTFTLTSLTLLGVFASTVLNASHCESVVTLNGELVHPLYVTVQIYCWEKTNEQILPLSSPKRGYCWARS